MGLAYNVGVLTEMIVTEVDRRGRGAQTRLAEALGVEVQTVNKWVKGQTSPDPSRWEGIEAHFEWDRGEIARRVVPVVDDSSVLELVQRLTAEVDALSARLEVLEQAPRRKRPAPPVA